MNPNKYILCLVLAVTLALPCLAVAKLECVNADGESLIIGNDIPSARTEAVNRAKWAAIEQVAGVDINSRTIVENAALLDDLITTRGQGVVKNYRISGEQKTSNSLLIRINACVEPSNARGAASAAALNSAVAVLLPSRQINSSSRYDDINIVSEKLNHVLLERGFTVRDLAASNVVRAADLDKALKSGNFVALRSVAYRYKTNTILIGKIEPVVSTSKGDDVGYGISMPFNRVTVRLAYRLLTRDPKGELTIFAAGNIEANGLAPAVEDAHAAAMKNLSEAASSELMAKINSRISELTNKVRIVVDGVKTIEEMFALRDMLAKQTWVTDVKEAELGVFQVAYPENPVYLANSLTQRGFKIISYSKETIRVRRP